MRRLVYALLLALVGAQNSEIFRQPHIADPNRCEAITVSTCSELPYNTTHYPNLLNHQNQKDAEAAIGQFQPLIKIKCSEDIKMFLCTVYVPVCTVLETPLPPCRHLCLSAKNGCESLMNKFGFRWPEQLECDRFPIDGICVGENKTSGEPPAPESQPGPGLTTLECPARMKSHSNGAFLQLVSGKIPECSIQCEADKKVPVLFDARTRRWLRLWTGLCAVACFFCSLFTICTFLVDLKRFTYPVRPILYMALCYFGLSIVYMIGVVGDDRFSCVESSPGGASLVAQGVELLPCSALAVAHYFFNIASSVWWVVLCLAWFLTATRHWGFEFIESLWLYFHAFAWGLPAVLAVIVLITNSFDGDVFTGICSVGNLQGEALMMYLVIPIASALGIGFFLLIMGIFSMVRIRKYIKLQHNDVDKLINKIEKLMLRITGFSSIYILATAAFTGILFYQSRKMPLWIESWYGQRCERTDRTNLGFQTSPTLCPKMKSNETVAQPEIMLFVVKYLLQLVVGVTCAIWIMSAKTAASYRKCWNRVVRGRTVVATADDELLPIGARREVLVHR
ncbi:unnamed protein product, partial [Mesorhabditis belari]|uniref:Frizzled-1 n=1 Tax=Mesorhabditis belari TaxID=2138241 RepID=A0AAF3F6J2_9BILA